MIDAVGSDVVFLVLMFVFSSIGVLVLLFLVSHRALASSPLVMRRRWLALCPKHKYGPIAVQYYGDNPAQPYNPPESGMLGIAAGEVVFLGALMNSGDGIRWPKDSIVSVNPAWSALYRHLPSGRWQVHSFSTAMGEWRDFAEALHTLCNVRLSDHRDRGPVQAKQVRQDMLGNWDNGVKVTLYLAPDRVLADWLTVVLLDQLRDITVVNTTGRLSLLRLEIEGAVRPRRVIGFELPATEAAHWAFALSERTGIPMQEQVGRKKKPEHP